MSLHKLLLLGAALTSLSIGQNAFAQKAGANPSKSSPEAILAAAKKQAEQYDELRAALRSPDASVRIATFQAMVGSGNPAMIDIALTEGISSSDVVLKNGALRAALQSSPSLSLVTVGDVRFSGNEDQFTYGLRSLKIEEFDPATAQFAGRWRNTRMTGQLAGSVLNFQDDDRLCSVTLANTPGTWDFEGPFYCVQSGSTLRGTFQTKIRG